MNYIHTANGMHSNIFTPSEILIENRWF